MNLRPEILHLREPSQTRAAFTLPEVTVGILILLLVSGAVIAIQLYGLRMFEFVKPKLGAADEARNALAQITEEVRSANIIRIGNGSATTFTEMSVNERQEGNAIQMWLWPNTNAYVRYYLDSANHRLMRMTSVTAPDVIANSVSNQMVFSSEDFAGNVITNNRNNRVIGLTLQFFQIQYPIMDIGPGNFYDFYQLKTKITRRTLL